MEEQNSNVNLLPETGADTGNYWCTWGYTISHEYGGRRKNYVKSAGYSG